jgi:TRAP transporter TAXI family solute receptor
MAISRRNFIIGSGLAASGIAGTASAQTNLPNLPSTMIWSTYDVGSTGYVEASAVADAFGKKYGSRVRLQPAGTAIGRVLPLKEGRVSHAWLANECYFAAEGLYEYAAPEWGPQDLRTLMGRQNAFSVVATKVSGITEPKHMKGKRFAIAKANSSVNIKTDPILAFADLTWKDVELVEFPSYAAALKALIEGKADAAGAAPAAAVLRELEASPNGISWVQLDPANKEGWAKAQKAVPFVEPFQESIGAGLSKDKPIWMMGYRYPMVTVYAKTPEAEVYAMIKAMTETFDLYKDSNPIMPRWDIKLAGTPPMDAAFHDGAIRYLKEIKVWSAAHDKFQAGALKRQKALQDGWTKMMAGPGKDAKAEDLAKMWEPERLKIIAAL